MLVALFSDPLSARLGGRSPFVALQQLEGHVVAPQVFGHTLRINPLLVHLRAAARAAQLYGILGALVALPLAAVVRETVVYLRRHLVLEPWGTPSPPPSVVGPSPGRRIAPTQCRRASDADCGRCGASRTARGRPSSQHGAR